MKTLNAHLQSKLVQVLITNRCNLTCGGCSQLCPLFPSHEHWDISLEQLEFSIRVLTHPCRGVHATDTIGIFGGEPTIHPEWPSVVRLLQSFSPQKFLIYTNGTNPSRIFDWPNFVWSIDNKSKGSERIFRATAVAACDVFPEQKSYWDLAQQKCYQWHRCLSMVYDGRAYLCEPAAAFDRVTLGKDRWSESSGWPLVVGKDPFDRSDEEIRQQAEPFCRRCGHCTGLHQSRIAGFMVTQTNTSLFDPKILDDHQHCEH